MVVKRQTVSFASARSVEQFSPKDAYWSNVYRFKAVRALVMNPEIRINSINHSLFITDSKPVGNDIKEGDERTYPFSIPHGDYLVSDLINTIEQIIAESFDNVHISWDEKKGKVTFSADEEDRYYIVNGLKEWDKDRPSGYEHTITRTLGFDGLQGETFPFLRGETLRFKIGKERVRAMFRPKNLYEPASLTEQDHDLEHHCQMDEWTRLLPQMYREIGRDVNIQLNTFSCVRTYYSSTDYAAVRGIAKLSLGAPGLPSKRLIASEMGARTPFDATITMRYVYADGKPLDDLRGFEGSTELLVFYK